MTRCVRLWQVFDFPTGPPILIRPTESVVPLAQANPLQEQCSRDTREALSLSGVGPLGEPAWRRCFPY